MTQLEAARSGQITEEMRICAEGEGTDPETLRRGIEEGTVVVVRNALHKGIKPLAIGKGLRTKINANIGTSRDRADVAAELEKVRICVEAGADTVMDLSTGGDIRAIRRAIVEASPLAIGTVPIYQAAARKLEQGKSFVDLSGEDLFEAIEENGRDGVDFITVHCGVTRRSVASVEAQGRLLGIVSRGGSLTAHWMEVNGLENPLFEHYDRLVEIARRYDMVLSLGDGLRPGCIADATDRGQIQELVLLGELAKRARDRGVQVMIEGPGHVPIQDIVANIQLQKRLCNGAPFYVLGPLPTDIAPGYDHLTSAIGGAIAGAAGADFLCYVTPSEHLRLPTLEDVREGIMASRIAAHIADLAKGLPGSWERDRSMARYRRELNWEGQIGASIDPEKSRAMLETSRSADEEGCTMCGEFCAVRMGRAGKIRREGT
ncbi:MAG: phosphomethylpyrimidine synthase [Deltaproteobacteria bacterium HGW-Deltaproteobacteria-19]|jgi:phosphomethylpyrimidine synthase|nr:MAG: phosphomethylpyrimidine synthase [Deltaproteobacteria bacterium HGW-Deltaproteobacteria-19]